MHGVSGATFYNWNARLGGMDVSEVRRPKALEEADRMLKKLLVEATMDSAMPENRNASNGDAHREARCRGWLQLGIGQHTLYPKWKTEERPPGNSTDSWRRMRALKAK